jgi:exopolysaccharide biosynthesis polyprenyl glycosylphosphotransferase
MYQGRKLQFDWTFVLVLGDIVAVFFTMGLSLLATPEESHPRPATALAYGVLVLLIFRSLRLYTWASFTNFRFTIRRVILGVLITAVCFVALRMFFSTLGTFAYVPWLLGITGFLILGVMVMRGCLRVLLMDILRVVPVERIAFVGWNARLERILHGLTKEMGRFQTVLGYFPRATADGVVKAPEAYRELGSLEELEKRIVEEKITLLLIDGTMLHRSELLNIGEVCSRCFVNLKVIPNIFDIWPTRVSLRVVNGIPLLGVYDLRYDRFHNRVAKRVLDIGCALFGLAVSAPVMLVLAFLIKRESPGPVIFRQTRLGRYGKPFQILKLRSMRIDAEKETGAKWAVKDDPRRLKIGTFMRAWNLDELPQFWNVLKGEMSMVGPRPERPEFVKDFKVTVHYYNLRHSCKPGVTGWAAVHGLRGDTSLEDRLDYDLFYIENWSLLLDIKIMFMTLAPPENAY